MGTNPAVFRRTMAGLRDAGIVQSGKGRGGGWQLSRPLAQITLLAVYEALGRPTLFAIGNRSENGSCLVEQKVNAVMAQTMREAQDLFTERFSALTLDQINPNSEEQAGA